MRRVPRLLHVDDGGRRAGLMEQEGRGEGAAEAANCGGGGVG